MKTKAIWIAVLLINCLSIFSQKWNAPEWNKFRYPEIVFKNKASDTEGWRIYDSLVPNPASFIQQHALWVAQTLYFSTDDSIPDIQTVFYDFEDKEGISAKGGEPPAVQIFYSSRWVELIYKRDGTHQVLYETRGVLYHELVHAYQAQPKGCGTYADGGEFWIFTEGLADAVRFHNGFFPITDRKPGGSWKDGYRKTGYFLQWLTSKDPNFLRKFNKTGIDFETWSFDRALQFIFGENVTTDQLWDEYQAFLKISLSAEEKSSE